MSRFILTAQLRLAAPTNVASIVNQINRGLRGVNVNVHINTGNVNSQLNNINRSLTSTSRNARAATNDIERFGEQAALAVRRYGAFTLATTAFIKLTHAIQSGINDAIKFDREIVRIAQVTGHSVGGLKDLNQEVTRLAKNYGVASSEILEAGVTLAQAGQSAKQVKIILESIAKTGVSATFGNLKNTTEAVIAAMQQFNLKAEDMEETLSSINAVSAKFAVESSDITTAIIRTGGAFQAAGGDIKEFEALFTSVRQTTRESAETIATGFRTIFTRLQRSRTQNFLQSLGIDLKGAAGEVDKFGKDIEGQFVGPYEAVRRLSTALKDLQSTDPRFAQIIEELGGFRQISKVIPLVQKFDVAQQALNVSMRSGNSLTEDADAAQQSLAVQISKVREEFLALIRNVANNTAFRGFLDLTLKLTSGLIRLADSLTPILPLLGAVAAIKIGSGFGDFARGFTGRIAGHANGGMVRGFATGGLVPGTGSGDTVPARLTPGEFVIRKNAVKAIGADNLHQINKFENGGKVNINQYSPLFGGKKNITKTMKDMISAHSEKNRDEVMDFGNGNKYSYNQLVAAANKNSQEFNLTGKPKDNIKRFGLGNTNAPGRVDLGKVISIVTPDEKFIGQSTPIEINGKLAQIGAATSSTKEGSDRVFAAFAQANFGDASPASIEKAKKTDIHAQTTAFGLKRGIGDAFNKHAVTGVVGAINNVIKNTPEFQTVNNIPPKTLVDLRDVISKSAQNSVKGILFEGVIRQAIGAKIGKGADSVVDFNNTRGFDNIFHDGSNIGDKAEAKATLNLKNARSTVLKTLKDRYGIAALPKKKGNLTQGELFPEHHAAGGFAGIGHTDTVPAMLTPGEFVINKKAAGKLGSVALNRLNKADKVQHFATGGPVQGGIGGALGAVQNPLVFGLLITSFQTIIKQIGLADTAFGKLTGHASEIGFQFTILKGIVSGLKDSFGPLNRLPHNDTRSQDRIASDLSARHFRDNVNTTRTNLQAGGASDRYIERFLARRTDRFQRQADRFGNAQAPGIFNSTGNRIARGLGTASILGGAVAEHVGSEFTKEGNKRIAEGDASGIDKAGTGGALSGAGTGAAAGAIFGPYGVALGALAGAIHGYNSAIETATKELEKVKFTKKMEEFTRTLDQFTAGKLAVGDARSSVLGNTKEFANKFINSSGEDRQNIRASFNNESGKIEQFITAISKDVDSFDQLERETKGLVNDFSILTSVPFKDLKDQITKQIAAQKKAAAFVKTTDKLRDAERLATVGLIAMSEAINSVAASFKVFDSNLTNAGKFLEGNGGGSTTLNGGDLLEKASSGKLSNTSELDAFTAGITKRFGETGKAQAGSVSENAKLLNALPELLLEAKNKTGFGDDEGRFEEVISKLIKERGFSDAAANNVTGGVRTAIGAEGKDEKIIDAIRNNLDQVAGEVGKSLQNVITSFKEFAPVFKDQSDRISSAFEIYTNAQIKAADIQQSIIKKDQNLLNFIAQARNKVRGNAAVNGDQLQRVGALTGGITDPKAILAQLQNAQAQSAKLGAQASSTSDVSEVEKLKSAQAEQNLIIIKANKALHELADNSETLAEIQKELAEVEERRKEKNGVLDTAVFGSRQDKLQQSRALAVTAHAQRFGIDAVPEELRSVVKSTLEGRGRFGQEELTRLKAGSRFGQAIGADNAKEISTQGDNPAANALLEAAKIYSETAKEADKALQTNALKLGDNVKEAISSQNKEFLDKLESVFKDNLIGDKNRQIGGLKGEQDDIDKKLAVAFKLKDRLGIDQSNKASAVGARDELDTRLKLRREQEKLNAIPDVTVDVNNTHGEDLKQRASRFSNAQGLNLGADFGDQFNKEAASGNERQFVLDRIKAAKEARQKDISDRFAVNTNNLQNNYGAVGRTLQAKADKLDNKGLEAAIDILKDDLELLGNDSIKKLSDRFNSLGSVIERLTTERRAIEDSKPTVQKATGGPIPGIGNTDTVPAMLTPGEFVMRKSAVEAIGLENLHAMNNGYNVGGLVQMFADGGDVRKQNFARYQAAARQAAADREARRADLANPDSHVRRSAATAIDNEQNRKARIAEQIRNQARPERRVANGPGVSNGTANKFRRQLTSAQKRVEDIRFNVATNNMFGGVPQTLEQNGVYHSPSAGTHVLNTRSNRQADKRFAALNERRGKKGLNPLEGRRHYNSGGHVSGGSVDIRGVEELRGVVEKFSTVVNGLAEKMSQFKDMSISLQATHKVEVTFNGAEVFSRLSPEFQKMAVEESKKAINNMLDSKFPDVGRVK